MRTENWGLIPYEDAVAKQMATVEDVFAGGDERLILCSHPPIVTLGRGSVASDLVGWSGEIIETSRGGRATYHGPSQIVVYPILDLRREREGVKTRDVHSYLRAVEQATVHALNGLGLRNAEARTTKQGDISLTGVWVGEKKIASIGVAVTRWITYHGMALNVTDDPKAFDGINPCGFSRSVMTNVERELERAVSVADVSPVIESSFLGCFDFKVPTHRDLHSV